MPDASDSVRQRRGRVLHDGLHDRRRSHYSPAEPEPMSATPQLIGATVSGPGGPRPASEAAWDLLGLAGSTFAFVAAVDILLLLLPARLGDSRWEFDAITAILGGMPLLFVGLLLGYASAYARERAGILRLWSVLALVAALFLIVAFTDYLLRIPAVLAGAGSNAERAELVKAMIRTSCQGVAYPLALSWLSLRAWVQASQT